MSDPEHPDRRPVSEGEDETVSAPYRDAQAPTRGPKSFVWVAVIVVAAVLVGALLVALGVGLLD